MKTLLTHLTRFAAFTAVTLAILFGLPALAERHPFILLAVSLSVLFWPCMPFTNRWPTPKRQSTAPPPTAKRPDPIIPS